MTRFHTRMMIVLLALLSSFVSPSHAQQVAGKKRGPAGTTTISGLVVPGSEKKLALRTRAAQFEFEWNARTRVALKINTRLLRRLKGGKLSFNVHSSTQVLTYQIPKGPITGIVALGGRRQVDKALATARQEQWIPERGLRLEFGQSVVEGQLPTSDDPRFIGTWNPATPPRTLRIGATAYEISLKRGGANHRSAVRPHHGRRLPPLRQPSHGHRITAWRRDCRRRDPCRTARGPGRTRRPESAPIPLHRRLDFRKLLARPARRIEGEVQPPPPADQLRSLRKRKREYCRMARGL